jgi:hypothetical protein
MSHFTATGERREAASERVVTERLNSTHHDTDPSRSAHCGRSETPDAILLPIGVSARHTWLHSGRWEAWREGRRTTAIAMLAEVGIGRPDAR